MIQLFGIKNCNTVQKAIAWLDQNNVNFTFIDVKKNLTDEHLRSWFKSLPENITPGMFVNQKGLTWRKLDEDEKSNINSKEGIISLIINKPSVMKRPVVTKNNQVMTLGFNEENFKKEIV